MNGWSEWRDWVTMGVFALAATFGLIGSCMQQTARDYAEAARKDAAPLIETCVTHPSARRVVVQ